MVLSVHWMTNHENQTAMLSVQFVSPIFVRSANLIFTVVLHDSTQLSTVGRRQGMGVCFWTSAIDRCNCVLKTRRRRLVTRPLRRKRHMGSTRDHRIPTGTETDAAIFGCRMALVKETVKVVSGMATRATASQRPENVGRGRAAMRRWM